MTTPSPPSEVSPAEQDLGERVIGHLLEISAGRCSISEAAIAAEPSPAMQQILAGLLFLHEELAYKARQGERHEEALRLAKAQAEAASNAKTEFLSRISHELRTPMNAILGIASLMKRDGATSEQAQRIDMLDRAAKYLLGIINGLLDLSKIEAGKFVLEHADLAVDRIVEDVCATLSELAHAKGLALRTQIESTPAGLRGDAVRLQQALVNYVSNAIKFTERGAITVRVRALQEAPQSVLLRFEVEDTGIGIGPDALPRLFTAFEQADGSTTRRYGGSGLGLAITKLLAQMMGGDAGAISATGAGSLFWFTASLEKVQGEAQPAEPAPATPAIQTLQREYRDSQILVVEDDAINRLVAGELLAHAGLKVDVAENGAEAVQRVQQKRYALIVMDMQMPVMDGLEAARRIRGLANGRDVPIVAMTASAFNEDRDACLAASMIDFVSKPFEAETLYRTLLHCLRGKPSP